MALANVMKSAVASVYVYQTFNYSLGKKVLCEPKNGEYLRGPKHQKAVSVVH